MSKSPKEQIKNLEALNENSRDILETIKAVHGEGVARAVYRITQLDRGIASIALLFNWGAPSKEIMELVFSRTFETGLDVYFDTLKALKVSEEDAESVSIVMQQIMDRQRKAIMETNTMTGGK